MTMNTDDAHLKFSHSNSQAYSGFENVCGLVR